MTDISAALTTYVTVLSSTKTEAECVRNDATSGGLKVNGTVVQEPKDASDAKKTALYSNLSGRMDAANSNLATAQQNLRTSLAPSDIARVKNCNVVFGVVSGLSVNYFKLYASRVIQNSILDAGHAKVQQATKMQNSIAAARARGGASPAEVRAANAELNRATRLEHQGKAYIDVARDYHAAPGTFKGEITDPAAARAAKVTGQKNTVMGASKTLSRVSNTLLVAGTGVGIWADKQSGESTEQAVVSNVSATATGAAVGFAIGSVVPGPGNVVGAAIGIAVGATASVVTSTFTDEMVDSLYEDNKGVGHAVEKGGEAVVQLGKDVGSGIGNAVKGVGEYLGW